ncbi:MAG: hypothetical protein WC877_00380 [Dehalococcoidales bacterium]
MTIDLDTIFKLKKQAMKNCEDRIHEAASHHPPVSDKSDESYGMTSVLRKRHGL